MYSITVRYNNVADSLTDISNLILKLKKKRSVALTCCHSVCCLIGDMPSPPDPQAEVPAGRWHEDTEVFVTICADRGIFHAWFEAKLLNTDSQPSVFWLGQFFLFWTYTNTHGSSAGSEQQPLSVSRVFFIRLKSLEFDKQALTSFHGVKKVTVFLHMEQKSCCSELGHTCSLKKDKVTGCPFDLVVKTIHQRRNSHLSFQGNKHWNKRWYFTKDTCSRIISVMTLKHPLSLTVCLTKPSKLTSLILTNLWVKRANCFC